MNNKIRGSFQMSESTKKAIALTAKEEGRTWNNMLEQLCIRAIKSNLKHE
tara:strand:- start:480 stop:629 length:150 start_codon:yes stop_codon:yes gene_type:complete